MGAPTQAVVAAVIIGSAIWLIIAVVVYLWYALALSGVFARLGVPSWRAWVPVRNEAEILRFGGFSPWLVLLYFVPLANLYALYLRVLSVHRVGRTFGRGAGTTALGMLLPPVWASVLALDPNGADQQSERRMALVPSAHPATGPLAALQALVAEGAAAPSATYAAPLQATRTAPQAAVQTVPPVWRSAPPLPVPVRPATLDAVRAVSAPPPAPAVPSTLPTPRVIPPMPAAPAPEPIDEETVTPRHSAAPMLAPVVPVVAAVSHPAFAPTAASSARNALVPPHGESAIEVHLPGAAGAASVLGVVDENDGEDTATALVDRRPRVRWELVVDDGRSYELSATVVVLGRRPVGAEPGVQYLAVADTSRSVSKAHARLTLADERWDITDLGSTNGVFVLDDSGAERELDAHETVALAERALLGTIGFRLRRREVA